MPGEQPWAPQTNHDQSCAFCRAARPNFVHRLDPAHVQFRAYEKGYTLPSFWAACSRCETLLAEGDDEELLHLMAASEGDAKVRQASLTAFRAADLGSESLADGPPDTIRS